MGCLLLSALERHMLQVSAAAAGCTVAATVLYTLVFTTVTVYGTAALKPNSVMSSTLPVANNLVDSHHVMITLMV